MICPRCGAENQPTAKICRMCATPLDPGQASVPKQSPYPGGAQPPLAPPGAPSPGPGEILCTTCKAVNDASWAYCQQCGSQLHKAQPAAAAPPPPKPAAAPAPPPPSRSPAPAPPP